MKITNINNAAYKMGLHLENPHGVAEGKERVAKEITTISWEDMRFENHVGKDGKEFKVVSYLNVKGEELNKDYIDVFNEKAQGNESEVYEYYVKNFIAEITKNLSDGSNIDKDTKALEEGINNLILEMQNNLKKGISNDIENLQTKFKVNGVDFTFKQLMDSSKVMDYAKSILITRGSDLNYDRYASLGIAKGKVNTYAKNNLNEKQRELLNKNISATVESIISSQYHRVNANYGEKVVRDNSNKYYGIKNVMFATNEEYGRNIMDTFASVDYSSDENIYKVLESFKGFIKPVLESSGIINTPRNQALTEVTNSYINEFKSYIDESYKKVVLSMRQVRDLYGNTQNIIDTHR